MPEAERASTSASTSAPRASAPALFDAAGKMHGLGVEPITRRAPARGLRRAVVATTSGARPGSPFARRSRRRARAPRACAGSASTRPARSSRSTSHDRAGQREPDRATTPGTSSSGWTTARPTQAARINETQHEVLRYVGGVVSPEMQTPKLLWLKEKLPRDLARAARFLDLPDFLVYRATGERRPLALHDRLQVDLPRPRRGRLASATSSGASGSAISPTRASRASARRVRPMGERAGHAHGEGARRSSASRRGPRSASPSSTRTREGSGLLGAAIDGGAPDAGRARARLALIGGTSSCHMAVSREPRFVPGVWGPYFSAMVPGMWLTEGGQSATGALLDHVIATHARGAALAARGERGRRRVYALLNERLDALAAKRRSPSRPRSRATSTSCPTTTATARRAPTRRCAAWSRASSSPTRVDALALLYLATVQALAHGTRHILDALRAARLPHDHRSLACRRRHEEPGLPARARRRDRLPRRPCRASRRRCSSGRRCSAPSRAATARRSSTRWGR